MSINVTALKSTFGKLVQGQQGKDFIVKEFLVPSVTETEFNMLPTELTQVRKAKAAVDQVLQAFQAELTPAGIVSFTPRTIDLQELKYELELDPDVIEDSIIGYLANPDTNDRSDWGITKYVVNELMIQKGRENFELHEAYKGVKAAIVPGTPSALGASYDGIGTIMAANIADFEVVNSAPIWSTDPVDFVTEVETWIEACRATSEINRTIIDNAVDKIHVSQTLAQRFKQGMRLKYNINYAQINDPMRPFNAERISVVGLPSKSGSNRIEMTFKQNRAGYIKRPKSETEVGVNLANPYAPTLYAKFWKALGYWHPEYVFVNQLV